ncbi:MAG: hypothetical protein Q4F70_01275 [Clostridia bacterium]|nr:hypothetical protein [Clostridia bacterium]
MTIVEKVAYLRGLAEGLNLNAEKSETKMFSAIMDVLEELAESHDELAETIDLMSAQLDEVDQDLGQVEELIYGACECEDDECCECGEHHADAFEPAAPARDEAPVEEDDTEYYEVECPACHEVICVDEGILEEGSVECPNCGEKLEFEIEFEN